MGPFGHIPMDFGPISVLSRGSGPGSWPFRAYFCPILEVQGLDLPYFSPDLAHFGGSGPGFGPFVLFGGLWIWAITLLFRGSWSGSGSLQTNLGNFRLGFGPFQVDFGVLFRGFGPGFGPFLSYFGCSGPGFGLFLSYFTDPGLDLGHFKPI